MNAVHVVLVRPEKAENVGAAARAMRNTGLRELRLVAPGDWRTLECWRSAWGAHELLERARVFERLADALAGASLAVALTGRRALDPPPADVRDAAGELSALPEPAEACLVFGPESSGLTLAEIALCGRRAHIPSHPDQPSLNLAQAVMVAGYEVFRARRGPCFGSAPRLASHDEKEAMLRSLRDGLLAIHALPPPRVETAFDDWRALFQRADLTRQELQLLEHMARKMAAARRPANES